MTEREKDIMVSMYANGKSCLEIGNTINRNSDTVRRHLQKLGVFKDQTNYITDEELENIINDYKNGMRPVDLAKKYNRRSATIISKLKQIGIYVDSRNNYTKEDEAFLIEHYRVGNWDAIFNRFPTVSKQSVYTKMSKMGIKYEPKNYWSINELQYLKDHYSTDSMSDISIALDGRHTKSAIQSKALKYLGISKDDDWTDEEIEILRNNYSTMPLDDMLEMLPGRSKDAITAKAKILGVRSLFFLQTYWSKEDTEFLLNNWKTLSDKEIGDHIHRPAKAVMNRRLRLNLKRCGNDPQNYGDLNKYLRGQIWKWKADSMKSCNYQCIFTGSKDFQIHHLYCVSRMLKDIFSDNAGLIEHKSLGEYSADELELITNLFIMEHTKYPLGVCVRRDIHKLYHDLYGKYDNNPKQWEHFKSKLISGKYKKIIRL